MIPSGTDDNFFVNLLNKYLYGKAWLAARPYTKDLEDRFYERVQKPLAELVAQAESSKMAEYKAILRLCDFFDVVAVKYRIVPKKGNSVRLNAKY